MRFVRIELVGPRDEELYPIVVDLKVDDAMRVAVDRPVFGAMGNHQGNEYWPFRLGRNGRIDFGCELEDADRFAEINLLEKTIALDEYCTYKDRECELTYKVNRFSFLDGP